MIFPHKIFLTKQSICISVGMIEMTPRLRKRLLKSKMIQSSRMLLQHWPFDGKFTLIKFSFIWINFVEILFLTFLCYIRLLIFSGSAISSSSKGDTFEECPPEYEEYLKLRCRRRSTVVSLAQLKTVLKEECDDDNEFITSTIKEDEEEKYWIVLS